MSFGRTWNQKTIKKWHLLSFWLFAILSYWLFAISKSHMAGGKFENIPMFLKRFAFFYPLVSIFVYSTMSTWQSLYNTPGQLTPFVWTNISKEWNNSGFILPFHPQQTSPGEHDIGLLWNTLDPVIEIIVLKLSHD